jgi:hypothetical protein
LSRTTIVLPAFLFGMTAACTGAPGDQTIDVVFDVCKPVAVTAPGADAAQLASIDQALASWRAQGVAALALTDAPADGPAIEIRFTEAAPAFHGVYEDELGIVFVNLSLPDGDPRAITIAHELGHAFGLWHVDTDDRISVMNPGNLSIAPNPDDAQALVDVWGPCPAVAGTFTR